MKTEEQTIIEGMESKFDNIDGMLKDLNGAFSLMSEELPECSKSVKEIIALLEKNTLDNKAFTEELRKLNEEIRKSNDEIRGFVPKKQEQTFFKKLINKTMEGR